jgi:hypothetical protein
LVLGSSDYFAVRTVTQIVKDLKIAGLLDLFRSKQWWSAYDQEFPVGAPPYHVSTQGIVLNREPTSGLWSLLLSTYRGRIAPVSGGISVGIAEQMQGHCPDNMLPWWRSGEIPYSLGGGRGDEHIFDCMERGFREELGLVPENYCPLRLLNCSLEPDMFFVTFLFLAVSGLEGKELHSRWLRAPDRDELGCLALYPLGYGDTSGPDKEGSVAQIERLLCRESLDVGPYLIPTAQEEGRWSVHGWHHASRMRLAVLRQYLKDQRL